MIVSDLHNIVYAFQTGSEQLAALTAAGQIAAQTDAQLYIIPVISHFESAGSLSIIQQPTIHSIFDSTISSGMHAYVYNGIIPQTIPGRIHTTVHIFTGNRIASFIELLRECQTDLLIIDQMQQSPWYERLFTHPLIERAAQLAPCPVLSIPEHYRHLEKELHAIF